MTLALPAEAGAKLRLLELAPEYSFLARQRHAVADLREAALLARLCWTLAWLDIKLRYRGSTLGPFWLTLSTAVMVGALAVLQSALFGVPLASYLPFLALSLVLWGFLGGLVGDACLCFVQSEGMIRSVRMPYSLYAARIVMRNVLILLHNVVVIVIVDLALQSWPGWVGIASIPAFGVWLIDGLALSILLGAFCARFRDIPPIVANVMQMAFFISGVIYKPEQLGASSWVLDFNPFYTLLEIVRGPLMNVTPPWTTYASALGYSAAMCLAAWLLFVRVRGRIAFWV